MRRGSVARVPHRVAPFAFGAETRTHAYLEESTMMVELIGLRPQRAPSEPNRRSEDSIDMPRCAFTVVAEYGQRAGKLHRTRADCPGSRVRCT